MNELKLTPALSALAKSCETICEVDCCGIGAYNFSAFNLIYHLTKWQAEIRDEDIRMLRAELLEFKENYGLNGKISHGATIIELNAVLTGKQVSALAEYIDTSLTEASEIFGREATRIEGSYRRYLDIIR